jgi:hypothetical protein
MRRMSAALVALSAAIALSALSAPAWATKPASKSVVVSPKKVKAGQSVKVSGGGCKGITVLVFLIDGKEFHRGYTKSGDWTYEVKLPRDVKSGDHHMGAVCRGSSHKPARFHVSKGKKDWDDEDKDYGKDDEDYDKDDDRDYGKDDDEDYDKKHKRSKGWFNVSPDVVTRGDKVWAEGAGCKRYAPVTITVNGHVVKRTYADEHGTFDKGVRIPRHAPKGRYLFSAKCGKRHLGSDGVKVKPIYKHDPDGMHTWGSRVKPGKKLRFRGDDCPDGKPWAKFDDAPVDLKVISKDKGFTAEATVPHHAAPGKHKFTAGCDGGSWGSAELMVLDPEDATTSQPFGPQRSTDLAMWAGLFAGLALLVASTIITSRRRRNQG